MNRKPAAAQQMSLPGAEGQSPSTAEVQKSGRRIPHMVILRTLQDPAHGVADIAETYRRRVLPIQTRNIRLLGRKAPARIIETLLGYEVQAYYKRIQCPDMVTARYIKLFTEIGCRAVRLPYDPTVTAALIPDLERSLAKLVAGVRDIYPKDRRLQLYVLQRMFGHLRRQMNAKP